MNKKEYRAYIKLVQAWLDPNGPWQKKHMRELADHPVGLEITMAEPAFDGDFEILFVHASKAEESRQRFSSHGNSAKIISFAEGMRRAQDPNCSGGPYIYEEGKKLIALNPALQDDAGGNHLVM